MDQRAIDSSNVLRVSLYGNAPSSFPPRCGLGVSFDAPSRNSAQVNRSTFAASDLSTSIASILDEFDRVFDDDDCVFPSQKQAAPQTSTSFSMGPPSSDSSGNQQSVLSLPFAGPSPPLPENAKTMSFKHHDFKQDAIAMQGMQPQPLTYFLNKPSNFLMCPSPFTAAPPNARSSEGLPPAKKIRLDDCVPALHRACLNPKVSAFEMDQLLRRHPQAASQSVIIKTNKPIMDPLTCKFVTKRTQEPYTFPLHLAIHNKVSHKVIEMLIKAAPSVLSIRDGRQRETPLAVLLKHSPDVKLVDTMLLLKPKCVFLKDRHDNTAVHVACMWGVSTDVLRHLCILHPKALTQRNFYFKTPFQTANERCYKKCSEAMCAFLTKFKEEEEAK